MEPLLLPSKITFEAGSKPNEGRVIIEPCYFGYGTTLGNALRRVLLSSLPGAAVTAVKIKGVTHEFSAIEGVKEDVVEILLNLKQLRLRVHTSEEVRMTLSASGEKKVKGKDILPISDVEIVNPKLHIAGLTDPKASLEMEIFASQGRGYVPVEAQDKHRLELGTIAVDSIFTPVVNVGYRVEFVRVGEITNFERLVLTVETDGTITPEAAVRDATQILMDHFALVKENADEVAVVGAPAAPSEEAAEEEGEKPVEEEPKKKRGRKKKEES